MAEAATYGCGRFSDCTGDCHMCVNERTPVDKRPKCPRGHPCEMLPSHRWACRQCYCYDAETMAQFATEK
jgi:hypothetical protein